MEDARESRRKRLAERKADRLAFITGQNRTLAPFAPQDGFDAIGEHTGVGHNRYIVVPFGGITTRFRGTRVITVYPVVPFSGKTAG
ncbi:hypothetical protein M5K25_021089 [Dendrobium thyrsiflorum]|uniref:Uncharacterized protein n=1 Tax=Dendrobium thyrsiflorum TaxID=117978 RepID=A0ABD0UIJ9_DENTH